MKSGQSGGAEVSGGERRVQGGHKPHDADWVGRPGKLAWGSPRLPHNETHSSAPAVS